MRLIGGSRRVVPGRAPDTRCQERVWLNSGGERVVRKPKPPKGPEDPPNDVRRVLLLGLLAQPVFYGGSRMLVGGRSSEDGTPRRVDSKAGLTVRCESLPMPQHAPRPPVWEGAAKHAPDRLMRGAVRRFTTMATRSPALVWRRSSRTCF